MKNYEKLKIMISIVFFILFFTFVYTNYRVRADNIFSESEGRNKIGDVIQKKGEKGKAVAVKPIKIFAPVST